MRSMIVMVAIMVCQIGMADDFEDLTEHATIKEIHAEAIRTRQESGLTTHPVLDAECCQIAQRHANWMAANHNMSHGSSDQIIASGYSTVRGAISAWRNSGGHWAWLGGGSEKCGWGYQRSADGTCYWAGAFRNHHIEQSVVQQQQQNAYYGYSRRRFGRHR